MALIQVATLERQIASLSLSLFCSILRFKRSYIATLLLRSFGVRMKQSTQITREVSCRNIYLFDRLFGVEMSENATAILLYETPRVKDKADT